MVSNSTSQEQLWSADRICLKRSVQLSARTDTTFGGLFYFDTDYLQGSSGEGGLRIGHPQGLGGCLAIKPRTGLIHSRGMALAIVAVAGAEMHQAAVEQQPAELPRYCAISAMDARLRRETTYLRDQSGGGCHGDRGRLTTSL